MPVRVTAIMLGVEDVSRSKEFCGTGLGCKIDQDHPTFVSFDLGDGSSSLALYEREAGAGRRRVLGRIGFRGMSFHFIVSTRDEVDEVLAKAVSAGGTLVKEAGGAQWGYFGYFDDPDGYLWKVACS